MSCPHQIDLAEYAIGKITDGEMKERIGKHLDGCANCREMARDFHVESARGIN